MRPGNRNVPMTSTDRAGAATAGAHAAPLGPYPLPDLKFGCAELAPVIGEAELRNVVQDAESWTREARQEAYQELLHPLFPISPLLPTCRDTSFWRS